MPTRRAALVAAGLAAATILTPFTATAQEGAPIVVGELNSYTRMAAFTEPYRKGWQMALDEVNAAGGVNGRPLEVVSRDDNGDPAAAVRIADELVSRDGAILLFGTYLSNVGLAVSDFANRSRVLFLASEPLSDAIVWSAGNRYTYRLRPSNWMQTGMLAQEAARLPATRWATIAPNYAYGTDAVDAFTRQLKALRPDVEFVEAQWPTLFKIDAGSSVRALERAEPEAIFNVTFGADLARFVREGSLRGLFEGRAVVSLLSGEPEYLLPLGAEAPEGWIVTGYPADDVDTPAHDAFEAAYRERWDEAPMVGSIVGYNSMLTIAALLRAAPTLETPDLLATMEGLRVEAPTGDFLYRPADNQATMGAWVGRLAVEDGTPKMVDWRYAAGEEYLPPEEEALSLRPAE